MSKSDFTKHLKKAESANRFILDYFVDEKILPEDSLYEALAKSVDKSFIKLKDKKIRQDILMMVPEPIAKTHQIIAYDSLEGGVLQIAGIDPDDIQTIEFIEKKNNARVQLSLTTPSGIAQALRLYHKSLETEFKGLSSGKSASREGGLLGGEDLKKLATDLPVVRLVNSMLEYAIFEGASDIHIEPGEKEVGVRYRIDGILRQVMTLPKTVLSGLVARVKILAHLKLDEHRLPQDGRFKIEDDNYKISFRVSTIPVFTGEKIVMRLLNEGNQLLRLGELGFREIDFKRIERATDRPHGMILVTGPTGSGKTTTLYAILNKLNTPEVNISTVEDPIEYRMPHVNQSQVNPKIGFTFAGGLRALLRQDPDIIMVGEIRDKETAEIAVHAAMTGHKVLSTLHTNSAPGTLPRLLDMGIVPFLIASTVNLVLAQRLVRKVCQDCIVSYNLDKEAVSQLSNQLDLKAFMRILQEESVVAMLFFKGKGCSKCGDTGYKGRMGIYEVLEMSDAIKNLIIKRASTAEVLKIARDEGMTPMVVDGLIKAKSGVTTIEEVLRVTRE